MLRFLTAGESHGPAEVAILEGVPAGLSLNHNDIQKELEKRRAGAGRGGRGKIEGDTVKILSGVRHGKTLGSPITLLVENQDFANWNEKMSIEDNPKVEKEGIKITNPRPGHADLAGSLKYRFDDIRNVLERASARETVMRVAVGAVCKKLLREFDISIASHTIQIGKIKLERQPEDFDEVAKVYKTDPEIHCVDKETSQKMKAEILATTIKKNTLGGVIEIVAHNMPVGLGSYVHYDRKLDGRIAQVLMSIPSVKAVEIGEGIGNTEKYGSQVHDEIFYQNGKFVRKTNRAGGLEGGVTNGQDIICRVYHKPLSTVGNALKTVDIKSKNPTRAVVERSDICVIPRAGIISECMLAYVLADSLLEKFGGDSISEIKYNYHNFNRG
ncbi:chorismate synthase [Candidatus Gottesmanbacteria bacterium]|nr:chorismate synthase [Candidatus Gottesmanbacteria bacterium]